jgi:hypothetical protein
VAGRCRSDSPSAVPDTKCTPGENDISLCVGRKIVELGTLVDNLKRGCVMCGDVLSITYSRREEIWPRTGTLYCMLEGINF